jgi:hypothetical protein
MATEIEALRAVDFNWTVRLEDVWSDPVCDVPEIHADFRKELAEELEDLQKQPGQPLGRVMIGTGGSGKTHLLSWLRREAVAKGFAFVLVDMTDVNNFWDTVCLAYKSSLEKPLNGQPQYRVILWRFLRNFWGAQSLAQAVKTITNRRSSRQQNPGGTENSLPRAHSRTPGCYPSPNRTELGGFRDVECRSRLVTRPADRR